MNSLIINNNNNNNSDYKSKFNNSFEQNGSNRTHIIGQPAASVNIAQHAKLNLSGNIYPQFMWPDSQLSQLDHQNTHRAVNEVDSNDDDINNNITNNNNNDDDDADAGHDDEVPGCDDEVPDSDEVDYCVGGYVRVKSPWSMSAIGKKCQMKGHNKQNNNNLLPILILNECGYDVADGEKITLWGMCIHCNSEYKSLPPNRRLREELNQEADEIMSDLKQMQDLYIHRPASDNEDEGDVADEVDYVDVDEGDREDGGGDDGNNDNYGDDGYGAYDGNVSDDINNCDDGYDADDGGNCDECFDGKQGGQQDYGDDAEDDDDDKGNEVEDCNGHVDGNADPEPDSEGVEFDFEVAAVAEGALPSEWYAPGFYQNASTPLPISPIVPKTVSVLDQMHGFIEGWLRPADLWHVDKNTEAIVTTSVVNSEGVVETSFQSTEAIVNTSEDVNLTQKQFGGGNMWYGKNERNIWQPKESMSVTADGAWALTNQSSFWNNNNNDPDWQPLDFVLKVVDTTKQLSEDELFLSQLSWDYECLADIWQKNTPMPDNNHQQLEDMFTTTKISNCAENEELEPKQEDEEQETKKGTNKDEFVAHQNHIHLQENVLVCEGSRCSSCNQRHSVPLEPMAKETRHQRVIEFLQTLEDVEGGCTGFGPKLIYNRKRRHSVSPRYSPLDETHPFCCHSYLDNDIAEDTLGGMLPQVDWKRDIAKRRNNNIAAIMFEDDDGFINNKADGTVRNNDNVNVVRIGENNILGCNGGGDCEQQDQQLLQLHEQQQQRNEEELEEIQQNQQPQPTTCKYWTVKSVLCDHHHYHHHYYYHHFPEDNNASNHIKNIDLNAGVEFGTVSDNNASYFNKSGSILQHVTTAIGARPLTR